MCGSTAKLSARLITICTGRHNNTTQAIKSYLTNHLHAQHRLLQSLTKSYLADHLHTQHWLLVLQSLTKSYLAIYIHAQHGLLQSLMKSYLAIYLHTQHRLLQSLMKNYLTNYLHTQITQHSVTGTCSSPSWPSYYPASYWHHYTDKSTLLYLHVSDKKQTSTKDSSLLLEAEEKN